MSFSILISAGVYRGISSVCTDTYSVELILIVYPQAFHLVISEVLSVHWQISNLNTTIKARFFQIPEVPRFLPDTAGAITRTAINVLAFVRKV